MDKWPWFPFYGRDFFGDETVKLFTLRQIGIYMALLWHQWEHGSIPSHEECARFPVIATAFFDEMRESGSASTTLNELEDVHYSCFKPLPENEERFYNLRLETIRQEQQRRDSVNQERARKGGLAKSMLQAHAKQVPSSACDVLKPAIHIQKQIQKKEEDTLVPWQERVTAFWTAYPKKKGKGNVEKWFQKHQPSEILVKSMLTKLDMLKKSPEWQKDNGQFIPHPYSWLNAKGWDDEPAMPARKERLPL